VIRLKPKEAIYLKTNVKKPGLYTAPIQSELDLTYETRFPVSALEESYTRLILDVLRGKQDAFVRFDELMAAWKILSPLLHELEEKKIQPIPYKFGSRGPAESDKLIEKYGFHRSDEYHDEWVASQNQNIARKAGIKLPVERAKL
jgi:glucose-6-phosphate 1-dehydrogenase